MRNSVFQFLLLFVFASASFAWQAKVVGVSDGDTITVLRGGNEQVKIRLYGIDAPESSQPFGKASKTNLSSLVFGKMVEIEATDTDKYGRTVAKVLVGEIDANARQIHDGYAWLYKQYCKSSDCQDWAVLESVAQKSERGLWAEASPVPPWEWRHGGQVSQGATSKDIVVASGEGPYHGNGNSGVFHRPGCQHYNCKNCVVVFGTRQEATSSGFRPCKICKP
jgi:endonuclease YncB( thermonuclease family)